MKKKELLISAYQELSAGKVNWDKVEKDLTELLTANKD